jgi:hypothetical protein
MSVLLALLALPSVVTGQEQVLVREGSLRQTFDTTINRLVISGSLDNMSALPLNEVQVKLYIPGPDVPDATVLATTIPTVAAGGTSQFTFRVAPDAIQGHQTFVLRVWRYEFAQAPAEMVLASAQPDDLPALYAVTRSLTHLISADPALVAASFDGASAAGRLCLIEASLRTRHPIALHYLAESLLAGNDLVAEDVRASIAALVVEMGDRSPFPELETWDTQGDTAADLEHLMRLLSVDALPLLVRMQYTGSPAGQQFATAYLAQAQMVQAEQQFAQVNQSVHPQLVAVYRDLAHRFPGDSRFRHALAIAEWQVNRFFLLFAGIITIGSAVLAMLYVPGQTRYGG